MSYSKRKSKTFLVLSLIISGLLSLTILGGCAAPLKEVDKNVGIEHEEVVKEPSETPVEDVPDANEKEPSLEEETPLNEPEKPPVSGELLVEFIDVGQGDSILVKSPDGMTMLIDAGDRGNFGAIDGRLKKHGVSKIDILVATHPHADHIGSMSEIVDSYEIGNIYMPDIIHTTKTFENLLLSIERKGLNISVGKAGESIPFGEIVSLDVLSPSGTPGDLNDHSIVLYLTFGENQFLFTGDMESGMESRISGSFEADVLKVGHHGSSTSTSQEFLSRINPEHSVISVGLGNKYDHPNSEVVQRLVNIGSKVYRTDESGHIIMLSDGININISANPSETVSIAPPQIKPIESEENKPSPESTSEDRIVFKTNTGSKYHLDGCRSLSKSKIETTIEEAKGIGLEPCGVCNPGD